MREVFKDIPTFEGMYQCSNIGNVRSVDRVIVNSKGIPHHNKGQILKPFKSKNGYLQITLTKKRYHFYIHELVALTFIGVRPDGYEIDHINRDKTDNRVENLRYITLQENRENRENKRDNYGKYC